MLVSSFALALGFVVANGGLDLSAAADRGQGADPTASAPGSIESPGSVAGSSASPTGGSPAPPTSVTGPSSEPSSAVSPAPTEPTMTPLPTPAPTPIATASRPSSDRYLLLKACPDAPDCWIYTVRSGDNLVSIARYFGVPLAEVRRLNPETETTQLIPDQELRLPPPTL